MTLEQLKTEIRNAYDARDRDRIEWALAQLDELASARQPATTATSNPSP